MVLTYTTMRRIYTLSLFLLWVSRSKYFIVFGMGLHIAAFNVLCQHHTVLGQFLGNPGIPHASTWGRSASRITSEGVKDLSSKLIYCCLWPP